MTSLRPGWPQTVVQPLVRDDELAGPALVHVVERGQDTLDVLTGSRLLSGGDDEFRSERFAAMDERVGAADQTTATFAL